MRQEERKEVDKAEDPESPPDQGDNAAPTEQPIVAPAVSTNAAEQAAGTGTYETNSKDKPNVFVRAWRFVKDSSHSGAVMAIFTVLIFVTNIAYVVVSFCQFSVLKKTLTDTETAGGISTNQTWQAIANINWLARDMNYAREQAEAATKVSERNSKRALDASITASQNSQRAWLWVTAITVANLPIAPGKRLMVNVYYRNSGRSPATSVTTGERHCSVGTQALNDFRGPIVVSPQRLNTDSGIAVPTPTTPLPGGSFFTIECADAPTKEDLDVLATANVLVDGALDYDDIFGIQRTTHYCAWTVEGGRTIQWCPHDNSVK